MSWRFYNYLNYKPPKVYFVTNFQSDLYPSGHIKYMETVGIELDNCKTTYAYKTDIFLLASP